jgi:hypothetical protein
MVLLGLVRSSEVGLGMTLVAGRPDGVRKTSVAPDSSPASLVAEIAHFDIDPGYLRETVEALTSFGSAEQGFRTAGTPEDRGVAEFVAGQFRSLGLTGVGIEPVDVDLWRFRSASVQADTGRRALHFSASSFAGSPPTTDGGIGGRLVDVGDPTRSRIGKLDLDGAVALVDWSSEAAGPGVFGLELAMRGAAGIILTSTPQGPFFRNEDAIGVFANDLPAPAIPVLMISRRDAQLLRTAGGSTGHTRVTLRLDAELESHVTGYNVVGYLAGEKAGPIVVGAHHDGWFRGAFDNATGVASLLALAKGLVSSGRRPAHTIAFTSRTGEEYGRHGVPHNWCTGAWEQVATTHPEWGDASPFHLCLECSGRPELPTVLAVPIELRGWARSVGRAAESAGWTPAGWKLDGPYTGTEQFPFLVRGVPGVCALSWGDSFSKEIYHTPFDTIEGIDFDLLSRQVRLYALLLLDADRRPDQILDHRARARDLARVAERLGHPSLHATALEWRSASGRAAFTAVGRSAFALNFNGSICYPHEQALSDRTALDAAISAVDRADRRAAVRELRKVGGNSLEKYLSNEGLRRYLRQFDPDVVAKTWGSAAHLTRTANLLDEIAALRGGAALEEIRPVLAAARDLANREVELRLSELCHSLITTTAAERTNR